MRSPEIVATPSATERAFDEGYLVEPVDNGGYLVTARGKDYATPQTIGAFTNAADLIAFLAEGHGVKRR